MLSDRFMISDEQWALMEPHCLGKKSDPGRSGGDARIFMESVLWVARTGAPWCDLPAEFGHWNSVFKRFRHWVKRDIFYRMLKDLSADSDFEYIMIDGTICKVHRHGQGAKRGTQSQAIGKSRGGMTTKILALTDALGNLIDFKLMPGQAHGLVKTRELLAGVYCQSLLADKAFDADWLRDLLAERSIEAVIPPKSNRQNPASCDMEVYKWRHLVENFFQKLKEFIRIAMRACKTDTSFEALIHIGATVIRTR